MELTQDKDQNIISFIFNFIKINWKYFATTAFISLTLLFLIYFSNNIDSVFKFLSFENIYQYNQLLIILEVLSILAFIISSTIYKIKNPEYFNFISWLKKIALENIFFILILFIGYNILISFLSLNFIYFLYPLLFYFGSLFLLLSFYICIIISTNFNEFIKVVQYLITEKTISTFTDLTRFLVITIFINYGFKYLFSILNYFFVLIFNISFQSQNILNAVSIITIFFEVLLIITYTIYLQLKVTKEYKNLSGAYLKNEIDTIGSNTIDDDEIL